MSVKNVRHGIRLWIKKLMISPQDVWFKKLIPANVRHLISKPLEKHVVRKTKIRCRGSDFKHVFCPSTYALLNLDFGCLQRGHFQSSGRSSKATPSCSSGS